MTTHDEQYVPSDEEMVSGLVQIPGEPAGIYRHVRVDEMKRGLARVRRDAEAELDSWMARAYEAEKRAWKAEKRLAGWMEHWNATARTGAVDEVAAILEANARADQAEARIKAVLDLCDDYSHTAIWGDKERIATSDIRRALESDPPPSA